MPQRKDTKIQIGNKNQDIIGFLLLLPVLSFLILGSIVSFKYINGEDLHIHTTPTDIQKAKLKVASGLEETTHLLDKSESINEDRKRALTKTIEQNITCPVFVIPRFVPLPDLPRERLMNATDEKEIIDILYDNIRDHQMYTQKQRQSLFDSYDKYLDTCK